MTMNGEGLTRWLLTVVFAGTGLYYLCRVAVAARHRRPLIDEGLHALMSAAMLAMWWSWGEAVPTIGYVTVFTAATLWFIARALSPRLGTGPAGSDSAQPGIHARRGALWYHAGMMASMSWMAYAMSAVSGSSPAGGRATPLAKGMPAMAGMDMSPPSPGGTAAMTLGTSPQWVAVPCLVLAVAFGVATVWLVVTALRSDRADSTLVWRGPVLNGLAGALMAAGMAISFSEMF